MIEEVTAGFNFISAFMLSLNLIVLLKDRKIYGVSLITLGFFTTYAAWMVFYFWQHEAVWPAIGAGFNFTVNLLYLCVATYYKRRQNDRFISTKNT